MHSALSLGFSMFLCFRCFRVWDFGFAGASCRAVDLSKPVKYEHDTIRLERVFLIFKSSACVGSIRFCCRLFMDKPKHIS